MVWLGVCYWETQTQRLSHCLFNVIIATMATIEQADQDNVKHVWLNLECVSNGRNQRAFKFVSQTHISSTNEHHSSGLVPWVSRNRHIHYPFKIGLKMVGLSPAVSVSVLLNILFLLYSCGAVSLWICWAWAVALFFSNSCVSYLYAMQMMSFVFEKSYQEIGTIDSNNLFTLAKKYTSEDICTVAITANKVVAQSTDL